jgi:hypothetical protein
MKVAKHNILLISRREKWRKSGNVVHENSFMEHADNGIFNFPFSTFNN